LAGKDIDLADRIGRLHGMEQVVLHKFLLEQQQPQGQHSLTVKELKLLTEVFEPLLFNARFTQILKRVLMLQFPDLAEKLDLMGQREIELLCQQVQEKKKRAA